jgi:hypothetical protein
VEEAVAGLGRAGVLGSSVTEKKDQEELLAKLYQQIGQMKVELDWLQKKLWSN